MRSILLSLSLICLGIGANAQSIGGPSAISSTGGSSDCTTDCTFDSIITEGTAPSLTANGAVFTASVSVIGTSPKIGMGVADGGAGGSGIIQWGSGYGDPTAPNTTAAGDKLDFFNYTGRTSKYALGLSATSGLWMQSQPGNGRAFSWWAAASGAAQVPSETMSLLPSGNLGLGTTSPLAKLSVVGDSSFSQPATFLSSVTAVTGLNVGSSGFKVGSDGQILSSGYPLTNIPTNGWYLSGQTALFNTAGGDGVTGFGIAAYTGAAFKPVAWFGPSGDGTTNVAQFGQAATVSTFTANGYYRPISYTTDQLAPGGAAGTPGGEGETVWNSTINDVCVSTANVSGGWALAGSKGATGCF